jgi:hypothetical protein
MSMWHYMQCPKDVPDARRRGRPGNMLCVCFRALCRNRVGVESLTARLRTIKGCYTVTGRVERAQSSGDMYSRSAVNQKREGNGDRQDEDIQSHDKVVDRGRGLNRTQTHGGLYGRWNCWMGITAGGDAGCGEVTKSESWIGMTRKGWRGRDDQIWGDVGNDGESELVARVCARVRVCVVRLGR